MQRSNQLHSRVNLAELKAQLVKRLGPDRSKLYFHYLNKLLSLKLSKVEFNKLCSRVIGRENVKLHNQLIHSILKNACNAKVPPSASTREENVFEFSSDGYQKNEDVLLSSPWGTRSGISVGSDGKADFSSQQSTITGNNVVLDNGDLDSHEIRKVVQHHQVISNNEGELVLSHPAKIKGSAERTFSLNTDKQSQVLIVRDGKEVSARSSLRAPLGIPLCPISVGGALQTQHLASSSRCIRSLDSGQLLNSETLKEHMQQIAAAHGLEGVSMDSANLLNNGLNVYLKRLIRSSIELMGTRCGYDSVRINMHKHHSHGKLANGALPDYQNHMQSSNRPLEEMHEQRCNLSLSLLDFKVAMGLEPQQLGENRSWLLETIFTLMHEE